MLPKTISGSFWVEGIAVLDLCCCCYSFTWMLQTNCLQMIVTGLVSSESQHRCYEVDILIMIMMMFIHKALLLCVILFDLYHFDNICLISLLCGFLLLCSTNHVLVTCAIFLSTKYFSVGNFCQRPYITTNIGCLFLPRRVKPTLLFTQF